MKNSYTKFFAQNKNIVFIALGTACVLLLPWLAMQFNDSVAWSLFDFVVVGVLLFGTGVAFELVYRRAGTLEYRVAAGAALAGALFLVWTNLAVGIIGSEDNPANMMYFGVLAVLFFGALLALLRPQGMARALFATAIAHTIVTIVALVIMPWSLDAIKTLALNAFFIALWTASGILFLRAASSSKSEA